MAEPIEFRADPGRRRLIRSVFEPSPLEEVAVAVAIASLEGAGDIYVERTKGRYRWSLAHRGGPYPLLRIVARFLHVDHQLAMIGYWTTPDGWCIWIKDPGARVEPDAFAVLRPSVHTAEGGVRAAIESTLAAHGSSWPVPRRPDLGPEVRLLLPGEQELVRPALTSILGCLLLETAGRPFVGFSTREDPAQYVQLLCHDGTVYAEVSSRMWEEPWRPLGVREVRRLRRLGFSGGGPRHNFARDGLPRDPRWLARLVRCLFRAAYGVRDLRGAAVNPSGELVRAALLGPVATRPAVGPAPAQGPSSENR